METPKLKLALSGMSPVLGASYRGPSKVASDASSPERGFLVPRTPTPLLASPATSVGQQAAAAYAALHHQYANASPVGDPRLPFPSPSLIRPLSFQEQLLLLQQSLSNAVSGAGWLVPASSAPANSLPSKPPS